MGQRAKVTDQAVIAAHGVAMTQVEMAAMLDVDITTVVRYLNRLGLVPLGRALAPLPGRFMRREHPGDAGRRAQLVSALADGYRTMQSVADELGLSKERIRQLALRYEITWPVRPALPHCQRCERPLPRDDRYHGLCRQHAHPGRLTYCAWCGKPKLLTYTQYRASIRPHPLRHEPTRNYFCNRICQGHWLGKHYGVNGSKRRPITRTCHRCGNQFEATAPRRLWCDACRPQDRRTYSTWRYHQLHPQATYQT